VIEFSLSLCVPFPEEIQFLPRSLLLLAAHGCEHWPAQTPFLMDGTTMMIKV